MLAAGAPVTRQQHDRVACRPEATRRTRRPNRVRLPQEKLLLTVLNQSSATKSSPEIFSRALSALESDGSKVNSGQSDRPPIIDSLLYEPLYIRAKNGQLPALQRVNRFLLEERLGGS